MNEPKILILTDGKIGDLVQCRGVASRISRPENISERVISPYWWHSLPLPFIGVQKGDRQGAANSPFNAPLPDLVLASGRRTLPYLRTFRRQRDHTQKPMMVFLKDPRSGRNAADFVWAPIHDGLAGDDVFSTHTSPHGLSDKVLKQAKISAARRFAEFDGPFTGVILGGDSGSVKWNKAAAEKFADTLRQLPVQETILVTPSRRTPPCLEDAVRKVGDTRSLWYWNGAGDNPYFEILMHADRLVVTGDSHNMVSESLATGKPVYVYRPSGLPNKLHRFLDAIEQIGAIKPAGEWQSFKPVKLDATDEIARVISGKLKTHFGE